VQRVQNIIVSPHPDDAALSCAGEMLFTDGVLVLNVFSRTAWWRFPYGPADLPKIQAARDMEEDLVSRLSGAEVRGLGLPEALLRGHRMEEVFTATPDRRDEEVVRNVTEAVAKLAREHPAARWYLPLGVGGHVDHRIARDAAFEGLGEVERARVHFYEDLPYAAKGEKTDFFEKRSDLQLSREMMTSTDVEDLLDWKVELLRAYWSQLTWGQIEDVRKYGREQGGTEVTWGFEE
jgi:LmbE family N-acetylglucosaminyl deacetylase